MGVTSLGCDREDLNLDAFLQTLFVCPDIFIRARVIVSGLSPEVMDIDFAIDNDAPTKLPCFLAKVIVLVAPANILFVEATNRLEYLSLESHAKS